MASRADLELPPAEFANGCNLVRMPNNKLLYMLETWHNLPATH